MTDIRLSLDDGLLARVDEARGDVARVRWIRRAVEAWLEEREPPPRIANPVQEAYPSRPVTASKAMATEDIVPTKLGHLFEAQSKGSMRCKCGRVMRDHS